MGAEMLTKGFEKPPSGYVGAVVEGSELKVAALNGAKHEFTIPFGQDPLATALPSLFSRLHEIDPELIGDLLALPG